MNLYFIQVEYLTAKGIVFRFSSMKAESKDEAKRIVIADLNQKNVLHCDIFDKTEYITNIYH